MIRRGRGWWDSAARARNKQGRQVAEKRTTNAARENRVLSLNRSAVYTFALPWVLARCHSFLFAFPVYFEL